MKRDDKSSAIFIEVRTGYRNNNTGSIAFPKQKHEKNKAFAVVIHKKQQTEIIYIPPLP